jgi:hypothetical protein
LGIFRNAGQIQQDEFAMQDAARSRQLQQQQMRQQQAGPSIPWSERNKYVSPYYSV